MKDNMCRYNKYGFCKYGDKCHFRHENVVCVVKKCTVLDCDKRHPVTCKYYRNFKRCKYLYCAYKHEKESDVNENDERIEMIEVTLKNVEATNKLTNIDILAKEIDKKVENEMKILRKVIEEKDLELSNLSKKLDISENKSKKKFEILKVKNKTVP